MRSQRCKLVRKIEDASLYLSVLVIGEIRKGIEKIPPKDNLSQRD